MSNDSTATAVFAPPNGSSQGGVTQKYLYGALLALLAPLILHASTVLDYTPESLWTYDLARWMNVPALTVATILALAGVRHLSLTFHGAVLALVVLGLTATSTVLQFHIGGAAEWIMLATLLTTAWLLAGLARAASPEETTKRLAFVLLVISTILTVRGLAAWLPHCLYDGTCSEFYGNYLAIGNRRAFNQIQTAIIPFLIWLAITREPGHVRNVALTNTTIMLWMVVATGARGTAVALILIGSIVAWRYRWTVTQWRTLAVLTLSSFIAVAVTNIAQYFLEPDEARAGTRFAIDLSSSGRIDLWRDVIKETFQAPFLGNGPGALAASPTKLAHAHNLLFEAAHNYGFIVAFVTALFLISGLTLSQARLPQEAQPVAWATGALLVHSLVSGVYFYPFGQILLLIMLSLTWGWATPVLRSPGWIVIEMTLCKRLVAGALICGLLAAMIVTFSSSFPDYDSGVGFVPRLWLGGRYSFIE